MTNGLTTSCIPTLSALPYRIVMVCTGNICRSAMAEIVLKERLIKAGIAAHVEVTSAGVSDEESGNPMDSRACSVLHAHGYGVDSHDSRDCEARQRHEAIARAITDHRAQQISRQQLENADLVLAMTGAHARSLRSLAQRWGIADTSNKIRLFREAFAPAEVIGSGIMDVPDPWYGGMADFEATLKTVEVVCEELTDCLRMMLTDAIPPSPVPTTHHPKA